MSRWLDRLAQLRSGGSVLAPGTPPTCSNCSIVQKAGPGWESEHLNNSNREAAWTKESGSQHRLDDTDLRDRYEERAAIHQHDGHHSKSKAERMAWNEVAYIWHSQHGSRVECGVCAGCGEALDGEPNLIHLPHGEQTHLDHHHHCIIAYFRRRNREAAKALSAIGIVTPPEIEAEIDESDAKNRHAETSARPC